MPDMNVGIPQHACGGDFVLVTEPGTFTIYGTEIPVDHLFYRCQTCGDEQVTEELAATVQSAAARAYREQFNFLTGAEIRAIRERLALTQEVLESALGLGAKSLARWENEKVLQNRSVDDLLRLIDRDPSALGFLAELHGVGFETPTECPTPCLLDGTKWPRTLLAQLNRSAAREKTALNTYLIMVLTRHLSESGVSAAARRLDESIKALQHVTRQQHAFHPYNDPPWLAAHKDVMREAATQGPHYAG